MPDEDLKGKLTDPNCKGQSGERQGALNEMPVEEKEMNGTGNEGDCGVGMVLKGERGWESEEGPGNPTKGVDLIPSKERRSEPFEDHWVRPPEPNLGVGSQTPGSHPGRGWEAVLPTKRCGKISDSTTSKPNPPHTLERIIKEEAPSTAALELEEED